MQPPLVGEAEDDERLVEVVKVGAAVVEGGAGLALGQFWR